MRKTVTLSCFHLRKVATEVAPTDKPNMLLGQLVGATLVATPYVGQESALRSLMQPIMSFPPLLMSFPRRRESSAWFVRGGIAC